MDTSSTTQAQSADVVDAAQPLATSLKEAKALGLKTYFTGKPCKNGNVAVRILSGLCMCRTCISERTERALAWQKANPERFAEIKARSVANPKCKERTKATKREHYKRNADAIVAKATEWMRRNKERAKEIRQRWIEKNPEAVKANNARGSDKRSKAIQRARPAWWSTWDRFVLREARELVALRTKLTGIPWEQDHVVPLQGQLASGLHCAANIQVIPRALNHWKHNRLELTEPGEWIKHL